MRFATHRRVRGPIGAAMIILIFACTLLGKVAAADEVSIAVAANFLEPLKVVKAAFETETEHRLKLSGGSTGELYTQIKNGAPFDVFLAADQKRPQLAEEEGFAVEGSRFTYAIGRLVLWSADKNRIAADGIAVLKAGDFRQLAVANPKTAPYGEAAVQALTRLGLYDALVPKLVQGQSLSQTYQFVALGSAELGFVALSQVRAIDSAGGEPGSQWLVPQELYSPILQDAVLLDHGAANAGAKAFLEFLNGPEGRRIVEASGYGTPNNR